MKPMTVCLLCLALAGPASLGSAGEVKRVNIGHGAQTIELSAPNGNAHTSSKSSTGALASAGTLTAMGKGAVSLHHSQGAISLDGGMGLGFGFNLML